MTRRPPTSTPKYPPFPNKTLFRFVWGVVSGSPSLRSSVVHAHQVVQPIWESKFSSENFQTAVSNKKRLSRSFQANVHMRQFTSKRFPSNFSQVQVSKESCPSTFL